MKPLIALLLLTVQAQAGTSDIQKTPACNAGGPVKVVQAEPDVYYLNPVLAIVIARQWVRDQKARRMAVPCHKAGRVRSPVDEQCWIPSRMP